MKGHLCPLELLAARSRRDLRNPCFAALKVEMNYGQLLVDGTPVDKNDTANNFLF